MDRRLEAGRHQQIWNARDQNGWEMPIDIYLVPVEIPEFRKSIKMVLLKYNGARGSIQELETRNYWPVANVRFSPAA